MAPLFGSHVQVPVEILVHIIQRLDPITLITLSECSKSWRILINPNRHDYIQRLLALELTPKYGGIVPLFDEHSQTLSPPCESPEWKSNKYACCGCMKLLPHTMFDNHALLCRPQRKPPPGSVEANKAKVTDWEPLEPSARWRWIQERAALSKVERKRWTRVVQRSRKPQPSSEASPISWTTELSHRDLNEEVEKYLIGGGRDRRRCIECQRRAGVHARKLSVYTDWGRQRMQFTAVISRQVKLTSYFERDFPGLLEWLPPDRFPRHWRFMSPPTNTLLLNLYVIHYPSCGKWQECNAFRQPIFKYGFPFPEKLNGPLLCNHCHLEAYQNPGLLAQELSANALATLQHARRVLEDEFENGWCIINQDFNMRGRGGEPARLEKYKAANNEILAQVLDGWVHIWVEDYSLMDDMHLWLSKQIAWVESNPNAVLNHVLNNNLYQIQSGR
ncbi:hypothetical protein B0I37DRAFT_399743 [Chaetomium sp. MPI-CAGE-AT-0009]|nr:hypothetical protein B0I37DRAFT_399743 [Chaetomium sp. MPI-CAGE-AT-0009]